MENLSDIELINNIKNNIETENSLEELISRHSGIYLDIVNSYMRNTYGNALKQDIINDKDLTIYNSALKYNEEKGAKFSTFLGNEGNEAKWKCLNASNKNKKNNKFIEIEDSTFNSEKEKIVFIESPTKREEEILSSFSEEIEKEKDKRIKKIFKLRYKGNRKLTPWRKVSQQMNLSIQGCINIHNSALNKISKTIKQKYETIT
jgi:Icc-related predicted phosphoesterase